MSVSMNGAWRHKLMDVYNDGETVNVRGTTSLELLHSSLRVNMRKPVLSIRQRNLGYRFMLAEAWWILSGRNDVATIEPYSPIIKNFSDDGIWFQGAYGPKLVDQLSYIVSTLAEDNYSRQAVATIWNRNPRASKDHSCTVSIQWMIRDGKLHCFDTMRSSDIWLGVPYDVFNFSMYSLYIALALREKGVKVELGDLYLCAASQHLYDRNYEAARHVARREVTAFEYDAVSVDMFTGPSNLIEYLDRAKDLMIGSTEWLYKNIPDLSKGKRESG